MSQAEPPVRLVKDTSAVAFTLALHARLRTRHQNLVFSPYSLRAALGMAAEGACTSTLAEMRQVVPDISPLSGCRARSPRHR